MSDTRSNLVPLTINELIKVSGGHLSYNQQIEEDIIHTYYKVPKVPPISGLSNQQLTQLTTLDY
ncbi:hypothetical protein [Alteromonas sp. KUL49]|uniref:hypothetical protein n=1 Tax=Alteromonas sp. KUL49 TaxID=2480798 RepID=UPI00102F1196|nr:hypothetical protein [Alteromonas sp. KUL49]TAP39167.1 hypothetical protein EYS00_11490 [Alteromonas sp. KUL49]GEA11939.1 hypothetical protein KUL49_23140 [Alteromonas sp. KUL49]